MAQQRAGLPAKKFEALILSPLIDLLLFTSRQNLDHTPVLLSLMLIVPALFPHKSSNTGTYSK